MVMGFYLSDEELEVFGVAREKKARWNGRCMYTVHCDICGEPIRTPFYNTDNVYKCESCKDKEIETSRRIKKLLKNKIEYEEAIEVGIDYDHYKRFESAVSNFGIKYYCAIEQASSVMDKFGSIPEAIACIELLYIGAKVIPQQKIGRYVVDFCLPDEKLIIEIDGALYHQNPNKEYWRDVAIKNLVGEEWMIKHIPAESLKDNHALFGKSMKKLLDDRKYELKIS